TPIMHVEEFVRGKGKFVNTQYVPTDERVNKKYPYIMTTGRILSQYNVGAQTRRTHNSMWHDEDRVEIHPHDAETLGINEGDWVGITSRAGETVLRAQISSRMQPGVVYTTFHFPESGANVITTDSSDWATNCPEYKVTAVQLTRVTQPSEWQRNYREFREKQIALLRQAEAERASGICLLVFGATRAARQRTMRCLCGATQAGKRSKHMRRSPPRRRWPSCTTARRMR